MLSRRDSCKITCKKGAKKKNPSPVITLCKRANPPVRNAASARRAISSKGFCRHCTARRSERGVESLSTTAANGLTADFISALKKVTAAYEKLAALKADNVADQNSLQRLAVNTRDSARLTRGTACIQQHWPQMQRGFFFKRAAGVHPMICRVIPSATSFLALSLATLPAPTKRPAWRDPARAATASNIKACQAQRGALPESGRRAEKSPARQARSSLRSSWSC